MTCPELQVAVSLAKCLYFAKCEFLNQPSQDFDALPAETVNRLILDARVILERYRPVAHHSV